MPTETDICNIALGKLGGAGDQSGGNAFISSIDGSDKISSWCKLNFPRSRRRTIKDLATRRCPFRSTVRFADLGSAVAAGSLPEIGEYLYAFNLPGDSLEVVRQFCEASIAGRTEPWPANPSGSVNYQWETIANKDANGVIFLTNTLSDLEQNSAFIEYVIDTPLPNSFSEEMIECIADLLAHGVSPVAGRDMETAAFMLAQYLEVAVPNAQAANQMGFNNSARSVPDYSGGRSGSGAGVSRAGGLGTYRDAAGNRRSIF